MKQNSIIGFDGLDDLAAFIRVAEARSFTAAAAVLGVSPSAVSHAIRQLEARIDARLFNRTTRSVSLTEAGAELLERIVPLMSELQSAVGEVSRSADRPAGVLRLNVPRTASLALIEPFLREFLDTYPEINLEVVIDGALSDIVGQGFDAGIRFGDVLEKDMRAVPIMPQLRVAIVASPDYFAQRDRPLHPNDLANHDCLNFRMVSAGTVYAWHLQKDEERVQVAVKGRFTSNDASVVLQAALDGVGLAYLFDQYVHRFLESGHLVRVLEDWSPIDGLYLYYFNRRRMPAKLRVFIDFLREAGQRAPRTVRTGPTAMRLPDAAGDGAVQSPDSASTAE